MATAQTTVVNPIAGAVHPGNFAPLIEKAGGDFTIVIDMDTLYQPGQADAPDTEMNVSYFAGHDVAEGATPMATLNPSIISGAQLAATGDTLKDVFWEAAGPYVKSAPFIQNLQSAMDGQSLREMAGDAPVSADNTLMVRINEDGTLHSVTADSEVERNGALVSDIETSVYAFNLPEAARDGLLATLQAPEIDTAQVTAAQRDVASGIAKTVDGGKIYVGAELEGADTGNPTISATGVIGGEDPVDWNDQIIRIDATIHPGAAAAGSSLSGMQNPVGSMVVGGLEAYVGDLPDVVSNRLAAGVQTAIGQPEGEVAFIARGLETGTKSAAEASLKGEFSGVNVGRVNTVLGTIDRTIADIGEDPTLQGQVVDRAQEAMDKLVRPGGTATVDITGLGAGPGG